MYLDYFNSDVIVRFTGRLLSQFRLCVCVFTLLSIQRCINFDTWSWCFTAGLYISLDFMAIAGVTTLTSRRGGLFFEAAQAANMDDAWMIMPQRFGFCCYLAVTWSKTTFLIDERSETKIWIFYEIFHISSTKPAKLEQKIQRGDRCVCDFLFLF